MLVGNKISKFKIRDIRTKVVQYGFSIFSVGFILYILIGVINHHLK